MKDYKMFGKEIINDFLFYIVLRHHPLLQPVDVPHGLHDQPTSRFQTGNPQIRITQKEIIPKAFLLQKIITPKNQIIGLIMTIRNRTQARTNLFIRK